MRTAQVDGTVTCVIMPADIQDMDAVPEQPLKTHTMPSGTGRWPPRQIPSVDQLISKQFGAPGRRAGRSRAQHIR